MFHVRNQCQPVVVICCAFCGWNRCCLFGKDERRSGAGKRWGHFAQENVFVKSARAPEELRPDLTLSRTTDRVDEARDGGVVRVVLTRQANLESAGVAQAGNVDRVQVHRGNGCRADGWFRNTC